MYSMEHEIQHKPNRGRVLKAVAGENWRRSSHHVVTIARRSSLGAPLVEQSVPTIDSVLQFLCPSIPAGKYTLITSWLNGSVREPQIQANTEKKQAAFKSLRDVAGIPERFNGKVDFHLLNRHYTGATIKS